MKLSFLPDLSTGHFSYAWVALVIMGCPIIPVGLEPNAFIALGSGWRNNW